MSAGLSRSDAEGESGIVTVAPVRGATGRSAPRSDYQRGYDDALMAMTDVQLQDSAILRRVRALADKWENGTPVTKAMARHLFIALAVHKNDPVHGRWNQNEHG